MEEEERQQILASTGNASRARVAGWAGDPPGVAQGEWGLQGGQLPAGAGRHCLRCPLVTLALPMGLFLVQDPKRFIAINYPNGAAVTIKPILQMRNRAHEEVNDTPGDGAGLEPGGQSLPSQLLMGLFLHPLGCALVG